MGFEVLKNYLVDILMGIWGILKPILWFIKKILIDFPVWFWHKFPFEYYYLFYILLFGGILVLLLEKIPAVSDFIFWHRDVLCLSEKFNIGVATHLLIYYDIRVLLLCMLIIFPGMAFCAALIQKK